MSKNSGEFSGNVSGRVFIVMLQTYVLKFQYKKAFNKNDAENDYSVEYQRCI